MTLRTPSHMPPGTAMRLAEVVGALSLATDLGTGHPLERAIRTCLLAVRLAEAMGKDEAMRQTVFYTALLRFAGCTADLLGLAAVFGDEQKAQVRTHHLEFLPANLFMDVVRHAGEGLGWAGRLRKIVFGIQYGLNAAAEATASHCEVAQSIARRLGLPEAVQAALGQLYERWDGRGAPARLKGEALDPAIRYVQLAQDVELYNRAGGIGAVTELVKHRAGRVYDPALAARFLSCAPDLLAALDNESVWAQMLAAEPGEPVMVRGDALDGALEAIADFSDMRIPHQYGHSPAVAGIAYAAARRYGMTEAEAQAIRRAALLHDVGRVAITLQIWSKPGALTAAEWERVRLYPYYTERVVARSPVLMPLGALAGLHRERWDGSGYFRGLSGETLSAAAALLAAADVYQSKQEPRAYREAQSAAAAAAISASSRGKANCRVIPSRLCSTAHPRRNRRARRG